MGNQSERGWFTGNGYVKRASIFVGLVLTIVMLFQAVGGPLAGFAGIATRDWHNKDLTRIEGMLACMYYEIEPPDCPYAPPKPPPRTAADGGER